MAVVGVYAFGASFIVLLRMGSLLEIMMTMGFFYSCVLICPRLLLRQANLEFENRDCSLNYTWNHK